ncbi:MAG: PEP/pyruvate-binding domain-containing protein [Burkholderiales bacterium]
MQALIVPLSAPEATDANRFGPKAANLAVLGQAGLPIPLGFCLDAQAYRIQLAALGLEHAARNIDSPEPGKARRAALDMKLGLLDRPITPQVLEPLLAARRDLLEASGGEPIVVRSSALVEDRFGSSFAGQFESYLELDDETDFLTAVRSCWAALWSTRVLRYMATHDASPADTAMAVLVQPLVQARVSGGGLSQSANGDMVLNATWGLGSAIAQGEVVPERIVLTREGKHHETALGRKYHSVGCKHDGRPLLPRTLFSQPCLSKAQAVELGRMLRQAETVMGMPVEIEWALDERGFKLLQGRPLHLEATPVPDEIWLRHPALNGQPAGVGWGSGRACVVNCECELSRIGPGDILVTKVAGPALSQILQQVAGVVAELGGSTSHLASLARERGIPMVLGVLDATTRIPDGAQVAVDGVAGVVRWMR